MRLSFATLLLSLSLFSVGCSTSQQVTLAKTNPRVISSVAQAPAEGNSPEMTGYLTGALQANGLNVKAPVPLGTRTTTDIDAIVSYGDVWRWDLAMYLRSLSVQIYDAKNGDLLALGEWQDSALHGFRDAKATMQGLVTEMVTKLRSASK